MKYSSSLALFVIFNFKTSKLLKKCSHLFFKKKIKIMKQYQKTQVQAWSSQIQIKFDHANLSEIKIL